MKPALRLELMRALQALVVEVIHSLWDQGHFRQNKILRMVRDNWFDVWVDVKARSTMRSVDRQAANLVNEWEIADDPEPIFTEEEEGETPLGGEMRLRGRWRPPGGV